MMSAVPMSADSAKPMENEAIVATDLTKWFGEGDTKMTAVIAGSPIKFVVRICFEAVVPWSQG
jgi:hypothetical protein